MDKYEYKVREDEINSLIQERKYKEAVEVADGIDWKNVKDYSMLCTVSDLYKICKRYDDSRDVLLLAYEKNPGARMILYSLCELSIKLGDVVNAIEYYKEFQQIAPKDSGRYILKYKLFTMQEVSLEERIEVLEEFQRHDYKEKWMYELAYLYHMIGYGEKCVGECNELVLYYGEGPYVVKALELKAMHEPLTQEQEALYNRLTGQDEELVKEVDVSKYSTIDLQKELADSLKEVLFDDKQAPPEYAVATVYEDENGELISSEPEIKEEEAPCVSEPEPEPVAMPAGEGMSEIKAAEPEKEPATPVSEKPAAQTAAEEAIKPGETLAEAVTKIFGADELREINSNLANNNNSVNNRPAGTPVMHTQPSPGNIAETILPSGERFGKAMEAAANPAIKFPNFDDLVSIEGDGQISLVVPEQEMVDRQITGQISIDDVLREWEQVKNANERRWEADIRRRVMEQTDNLFREFDASSRSGLLEELEEAVVESPGTELTADELAALRNSDNAVYLNIDVEEEAPASPEEQVSELEPEIKAEPVRSDDIKEIIPEPVPEPEVKPEAIPAEKTPEIKEKEISIRPEISSNAPEPDAEDNTAVLPKAEEIDYFMQVAAAGEERDREETVEPAEKEQVEEVPEETPEESAVAYEPEEIAEVQKETDEITETEEIAEPEEEPEQPEEAEEVTEEEVEETPEKPGSTEPEAERTAKKSETAGTKAVPYMESVDGLTDEQFDRFESFIQTENGRDQLFKALSLISTQASVGNVIIDSNDTDSSMELAKAMLVELSTREELGRIAKIKGSTLNAKDAYSTLTALNGGGMVIHEAEDLRRETLEGIDRALHTEGMKLFVVLTVNRRHKASFISENEHLLSAFNVSFDIEAPDNAELASYARRYAYAREYSIDEMGMLALHTRIDDRQTNTHSVMVGEVRELVDEAIVRASKKSVGHFFKVLAGKRYDSNDMIVLGEKDFIEK